MDQLGDLNELDSNFNASRRESCVSETVPIPLKNQAGIRTETRRQRYMLRGNGTMRMGWDFGIMILAVWNCFYVPFAVAFLPPEETSVLLTLDFATDFVYILDIFVYLRSSYIDLSTGEEVTASSLILKRYFSSGKLAVDMIAAIPFDLLAYLSSISEEQQLVTLLKIMRLLRLGKIVMFLHAQTHLQLKTKLFQLLFLFIAYLHFVACLWFLLTNASQQYTPPGLYLMEHPGLFTADNWRKYAYSLYMSVYMLTGAEIGPRTEWERLFAGVAIITGQIFQAFMFGEISVVISDLNIKSQKISDIQDAAVTTMVSMHLDPVLCREISDYLISNQGELLRQSEFEALFTSLPPSLKQAIRGSIFSRAVDLNPALNGHPRIATSVLHRLKNLYCKPEETIIVQGQEADALYFVSSGKCEAWVLDEFRAAHKAKYLQTGSHFGEVALLFPTPRTATVITSEYTNLAVLPKADFDFLCQKYPKAANLFKFTAMKYHDEWKRFLKSTLRRCPLFNRLHSSVLNSLIHMLPTTRLAENTYLYKEGDIADKIVFIIGGTVEVYFPVNDARLARYTNSEQHTKELNEMVNKVKFNRKSLISMVQKSDMRYIVKVLMDSLGMGSVLCPNLALLGEKVGFYAKTTEKTVVMTLSSELLHTICSDSLEIRDAVGKYTDSVYHDTDRHCRMRRIHMSATDYEKHDILKQQSISSDRLLKAKMKVRRCILGKIIEKRTLRAKGFSNVLSLSHNLKTVLEAELRGDFKTAEKVRIGIFPLSGIANLGKTLQLLELSEVENPIMTQFAVEAAKMDQYLDEIIRKVEIIRDRFSECGEFQRKTKLKFATVHEMASLMERLSALA